MTLEEAKRIFGIETLTKDIDIKKIYRSLVFANHPDAHPENSSDYEEKIKIINEAYSILEHNNFYEEVTSDREEKERYEKNKQIKKEQILTEIIVKSYYQSQPEINKSRLNMLDSYIAKASKLNITRAPSMQILEPVTMEYAKNETQILNAFVKQNIETFIEDFQLEVPSNNKFSFLYFFEPLYFLDLMPDWYEKIIERENVSKIEDTNKHTL